MRPLSIAEVRAINRLVNEGLCSKQIAARVGRSTNAINRVKRGIVTGLALKISRMDRIDIHAWHKARKALDTIASMARKYKVSQQYIRDICRTMDRAEKAQAQSFGDRIEARQ